MDYSNDAMAEVLSFLKSPPFAGDFWGVGDGPVSGRDRPASVREGRKCSGWTREC